MDIINNNTDSFGTDFTENKKILNKITIVRSKGLKNEIAGYITNFIKKQIKLKEEKQDSEPEEKEVTISEPEEKEVTISEPEEKEVTVSEPEEKEVTVSDESN